MLDLIEIPLTEEGFEFVRYGGAHAAMLRCSLLTVLCCAAVLRRADGSMSIACREEALVSAAVLPLGC